VRKTDTLHVNSSREVALAFLLWNWAAIQTAYALAQKAPATGKLRSQSLWSRGIKYLRLLKPDTSYILATRS